MFQRIIVPLDESPLSERMLEYASAFAERLDARLTLLRAYNWTERFAMVDTPTIEVVTDGGRKDAAAAREFLEGKAQPLRGRGLRVDTVVVDAPPPQAILEESIREPRTMVVIGSHDRGWLSRLVRGGTLHDVLQDFTVPVLIVREGT